MTTAGGQAAPRRVLLDTDIGGDIDDAWALAFLLRSPELALVGVTTVTGDAAGRAKLAVKLCDIAGRSDIPVAAGYGFETPEQPQLRFSADYTKRAPLNEHAVDFIIRTLRAEKEPLTIVPIGPLANIAEVLQRAPELKPKIAEIVAMAGSAFCGYGAGTLPCAEYNVAQNAAAAQVVFSSGVPITMVPLDCTWMLQPSAEQLQALAASKDPLAQAVAELTKLWPGRVPTLFDVAAVWACFDRSQMAEHPLRIVVDGGGYTRVTEGKPNTTAVLGIDRAALLEVCLQRLMP